MLCQDVVVNGRFVVQSLSGVQRFATEMSAALGRTWSESLPACPRLLTPSRSNSSESLPLPATEVGRSRGQVWEQLELPYFVAGKLLINLGNTAPIIVRRQIIVIHDAGTFTRPEAYSFRFRLWYRALQKALTLTQTRIVTVSEFSRLELVRHLGIRSDAIDVISEGADHMHRIVPQWDILQHHGLKPGRFVLAVGNLSTHKNLAALSRTAQMLADRGMTLVITGGLDNHVFQYKTVLPNPATYVGRVSDEQLCALYRSAACFVFPSLYEGFGLPAIEAMACNCAVVTSQIPALQEVCKDAALYADPCSPEAIAHEVARLIDDDSLRTEMRAKAKLHAQSYTWDAAASALAAIAREMLT